MKISAQNFAALVERIKKIEMLKGGDYRPPWADASPLTEDLLSGPLADGAPFLPVPYRDAYVTPLQTNLAHLVHSHDDPRQVAILVETLGGAVIQLTPDVTLRGPLRQFLAVVSNYYRSFLSETKRKALELPSGLGGLPPLAAFCRQKETSPFTLPADLVEKLCGAKVAVVSLPERLKDHPACWLTLAHETTGHDILHADPTLLPELVVGVRSMFGGGPLAPGGKPDDDQIQALLWSYWVDEVASDVFALLNGGPAFAYNLAAFLEALRADHPGLGSRLDRRSRWDPLDTHPTGVLRLSVAVGVVENLTGLDPADRKGHVANLRSLIRRESPPKSLRVRGRVEIERDRWADLDQDVAIADLSQAGRRVGAYVATARLHAFGGRSVQELETWDADDERIATIISQVMVDPKINPADKTEQVKILGDDAQLLAGATLALLQQPEQYDDINFNLSQALTESFRRDPIVGFSSPHSAFDLPPATPPDSQPETDARTADRETAMGGPPIPTPAPRPDTPDGEEPSARSAPATGPGH